MASLAKQMPSPGLIANLELDMKAHACRNRRYGVVDALLTKVTKKAHHPCMVSLSSGRNRCEGYLSLITH